jgi:hypothetical protein
MSRLVLVAGQAFEGGPCRGQCRDRVAFLAQRPVQGVDHPGSPLGELGADSQVPAPALPARPGSTRLEVGEPGEVQDVAQSAQLGVGQHVGLGQGGPDKPALHALQQQIRARRREFGRVQLSGVECGGVVAVVRVVLIRPDAVELVRLTRAVVRKHPFSPATPTPAPGSPA